MDQVSPAELLTLLDIHFEKAITIFSTAALTDDKVQVDFYGTEIHPKLFKRIWFSRYYYEEEMFFLMKRRRNNGYKFKKNDSKYSLAYI